MSEQDLKTGMGSLIADLQAAYERKVASDPDHEAKVAARRVQEALEEKKQEEWRRRARLENRGIPLKDVSRILSGDIADTRAMTAARAFLDDLDKQMLVLSGTRGCGKTFAASWIAAQDCPDIYFDRREYTASSGWPSSLHPRFLDAPQLARLPRYDAEVMVPLERCSMLVLDDLGMEYADVKGAFHSLLDGLINARYAAKVRTIITTNIPAEGFKTRYGERIVDRIRETGTFIEIADASMRGK